MAELPGAATATGGPLQRLIGHLNARSREGADNAYLDGVRDMIAAAIELLAEFEGRVPPVVAHPEEGPEAESEPLPLDRTSQRIATELRLTAATLSRLTKREELNPTGQIDPAQLPIIADVVGLLLVAAHALERVRPAENGNGPNGIMTVPPGEKSDPDSAANWLAAFVVSVATNRQPNEEDAVELRRLCQGDERAMDSAFVKVERADDLAESVRERALRLLRMAR